MTLRSKFKFGVKIFLYSIKGLVLVTLSVVPIYGMPFEAV